MKEKTMESVAESVVNVSQKTGDAMGQVSNAVEKTSGAVTVAVEKTGNAVASAVEKTGEAVKTVADSGSTIMGDISSLSRDMVGGLLETLRTTKDFMISEVPEVVKELIMYNTIILWGMVVFGIILFLIGSINIYKIDREKLKKENNYEVSKLVICAILSLIGIGIFFGHIFETIKITFAQRIWLIEYLSALYNGTR